MESLTHSTPFRRRTISRRCSTPPKVVATARIAGASAPAAPARQQAARMLARLCRPRSRTSVARQISTSATPRRRQISGSPRRKAPAAHLIHKAEAQACPLQRESRRRPGLRLRGDLAAAPAQPRPGVGVIGIQHARIARASGNAGCWPWPRRSGSSTGAGPGDSA